MIQYREVQADEINRDLFKDFIRRQVVTKCWRKENGIWVIREDPFTDDWSESDYRILISCLRNTMQTGGFVYAAFYMDMLKGFVSAEAELFGEERKYVDLSSIHVSEDMRNHGIGTRLFLAAKEWAGKRGADKLYISAHSAKESIAAYKKYGCVPAAEPDGAHVVKEPFDLQLEYDLSPRIYEVEDKEEYMQLLLLADEQREMVERYLSCGVMFVIDDCGVKGEIVVSDIGDGILEIKNLAVNLR